MLEYYGIMIILRMVNTWYHHYHNHHNNHRNHHNHRIWRDAVDLYHVGINGMAKAQQRDEYPG